MTIWLQPLLWEPLQEPSFLSRYPESLIQIAIDAPKHQPVERIAIYQRLSVIYWMAAQREPTIEEVAENLSAALVEREALISRRERYVLEFCESLERGKNRLQPQPLRGDFYDFLGLSPTGEEGLFWRISTRLIKGKRSIEAVFGSREQLLFGVPDSPDYAVVLSNRELNVCTQSWLLNLILRAESEGG